MSEHINRPKNLIAHKITPDVRSQTVGVSHSNFIIGKFGYIINNIENNTVVGKYSEYFTLL